MADSKYWRFKTRKGAIIDADGRHTGWQDYVTIEIYPYMALEILQTIARQMQMDLYDAPDEYVHFTVAGKLKRIKDDG